MDERLAREQRSPSPPPIRPRRSSGEENVGGRPITEANDRPSKIPFNKINLHFHFQLINVDRDGVPVEEEAIVLAEAVHSVVVEEDSVHLRVEHSMSHSTR